VLEALACRTAVITSRLSSMPEVGGEAASYVDPHDVGDIRAALVDLLSDEQKRSALAARGPAQAARFTWERTAQRTLELVEAAAR
jgi:glycosyltransferase involved in cell wall biosynthesis